MESRIKLLLSYLGENRVKQNIDISEYLQTGLGGLAQAFYIATTTRELVRSAELCQELKIPFLVVGAGSKIAISADGIRGLVIKNRSDNLKVFGIKGKVSRLGIGIEEVFIEADSGATLSKLVEFASAQGLGGLDVLRSSPGTVGGAFFLSPILQEKSHQVKVLTQAGSQKIKQAPKVLRDDIILSAVFKLKAKRV